MTRRHRKFQELAGKGLRAKRGRFVCATVVGLFSLSVAAPPVGIVAHRHAGDAVPHVHSALSVAWAAVRVESADADLPFSQNDTPADWWARPREPRAEGPRWAPASHARPAHLHAYSPFQPLVLALFLHEVEGPRLEGAFRPEPIPFQRTGIYRYFSRAPPRTRT